MLDELRDLTAPEFLLLLPALVLLTLIALLLSRRRHPTKVTHTVRYEAGKASTEMAAGALTVPAPESQDVKAEMPGVGLLRTAEDLSSTEALAEKIRHAADCQDHTGHAFARIELGDLAHHEGDLTTACEHWQIARQLFADLNRADEQKKVEDRMRCNGCPTDWVLNNF